MRKLRLRNLSNIMKLKPVAEVEVKYRLPNLRLCPYSPGHKHIPSRRDQLSLSGKSQLSAVSRHNFGVTGSLLLPSSSSCHLPAPQPQPSLYCTAYLEILSR